MGWGRGKRCGKGSREEGEEGRGDEYLLDWVEGRLDGLGGVR